MPNFFVYFWASFSCWDGSTTYIEGWKSSSFLNKKTPLKKCKKLELEHMDDWKKLQKHLCGTFQPITLPETNIADIAPEHSPSQKETIVFQSSIFRCYVSFREGILSSKYTYKLPLNPNRIRSWKIGLNRPWTFESEIHTSSPMTSTSLDFLLSQKRWLVYFTYLRDVSNSSREWNVIHWS